MLELEENELLILKSNDLARKIFCHYILDRCQNGDVIALRRALKYFKKTMTANDLDEVYETTFQSIINFLIENHRVHILLYNEWREFMQMLITIPEVVKECSVEMLKNIRIWSEVTAERLKDYIINERTKNCIGGLYNINTFPSPPAKNATTN
ncbi:18296_t:CDS:2 [Gigaspora margarita]|uniref:18296_t:CDS:1 n=1 Tax=Gigaspora margarita TaxID=4874 RepID=A0ABN7VR16_GIGMA|nr:18296_t:CDS:2 [Gigaspora margarita]